MIHKVIQVYLINFLGVFAARHFDDTKEFKFISYAVWWIRQKILLALADNLRLVRVPLNKLALNGRIQKVNSMVELKKSNSNSKTSATL